MRRQVSKEEEKYKTSSLMQLPQHIIMEILCRLPILSLFPCTLVCKAWKDIILNNPIFAKMQLNHALEKQNRTPGLMFFLRNLAEKDVDANLYFVQRDVGHRKLMVMKAQFNGLNRCFRILGSCNGLICISAYAIGGPAYVSNPITGECFMLPSKESTYANLSGFGFDSSNNEYKLVRMVSKYPMQRIRDDDTWKAEIYTLGTNDWRELEVGNALISYAEDTLFQEFSNVLVNGSLHWQSDVSRRPLRIISLDMGHEQFGLVRAPEICSLDVMQLMAWKGRLTVLQKASHRNGLSYVVIWVMNKYNVKESWTKQVKFGWPYWFSPIDYWPIDDESLEDDLQVIDHPCFRPCRPNNYRFGVIAHVGSLTSLKTVIGKVEIGTGSSPRLSMDESTHKRIKMSWQ